MYTYICLSVLGPGGLIKSTLGQKASKTTLRELKPIGFVSVFGSTSKAQTGIESVCFYML